VRARSVALALVGLAILGGGALLVYEVRRPVPSTLAVDAGVPAPALLASARPDASAEAVAPPRPVPDGPLRVRTDASGLVRADRIGGRDVYWVIDHNAPLGKEGVFVNVHETGYATKDEYARAVALVRKMLEQMGNPDPARPLADAFPKALTEELQRTIKAPVFLRVDGRPAVWIPQIKLR